MNIYTFFNKVTFPLKHKQKFTSSIRKETVDMHKFLRTNNVLSSYPRLG